MYHEDKSEIEESHLHVFKGVLVLVNISHIWSISSCNISLAGWVGLDWGGYFLSSEERPSFLCLKVAMNEITVCVMRIIMSV